MVQPIGELVLRLEIGDDGFENGGVQKAVARGEGDVFINDGGTAGGRLPVDTIMSGNAHEKIDDHQMLARDVDSTGSEAAPQDFRDGCREIVDMGKRPFLVQISIKHERFALSRHGEAFVDMACGRGEAILFTIKFTVAEDMWRDRVATEAAPCFKQVLRLCDGGVAKTMRVDF